MKQKLLLVLLLAGGILLATGAAAQGLAEPRPHWYSSVPSPPPGANFIYMSGVGLGVDEAEARERARGDALYKAFMSLGLVGFPGEQLTLADMMDMSKATVLMGMNRRRFQEVCMTPPVSNPEGEARERIKVYVLYKVQEKANMPMRQHVEQVLCQDRAFQVAYGEWTRGIAEQREAAGRKERRRHFWHSVFAGRSYTLWGAGYTYGLSEFNTSIVQRWGGILGIGYHGTVGMHIAKDANTGHKKEMLFWSAGARLYPYKYLFVGASYGVVEAEHAHPANRVLVKEWSSRLGFQYTGGVDLIWPPDDLQGFTWGVQLEGGVKVVDGSLKPIVGAKLSIGGFY
ncbi:MAG: hypothetical protein CSA97_00215 [Bacteroidetes bacterium]|nr:MAG: hypothetical protein CSA97_00215 [Bacteroidota bacterium]